MPVEEESRLPDLCLVCLLLAPCAEQQNHNTFRLWVALANSCLEFKHTLFENVSLCLLIMTTAYAKRGLGKANASRCQGTSTWYQSIRVPRTRYWVPGIDELLGTWDRRGTGYLERGAGYPGSTRYWVAGRRLRWSAAVAEIVLRN